MAHALHVSIFNCDPARVRFVHVRVNLFIIHPPHSLARSDCNLAAVSCHVAAGASCFDSLLMFLVNKFTATIQEMPEMHATVSS